MTFNLSSSKTKKAQKRLTFYLSGTIAYHMPVVILRLWRWLAYHSLTKKEWSIVQERVDFYNKCSAPKTADTEGCNTAMQQKATVKDFRMESNGDGKKHTAYFLALFPFVKVHDSNRIFYYTFGDVRHVPQVPAFVKSRPIHDNNENSVVMKLNAVRHFLFLNDKKDWTTKKNAIVSRNIVAQPHRILLMQTWFGHPMCDFGQINPEAWDGHTEWIKPFMSMEEQLDYKFIACIEGNDVATNLKWVMSSNSIAVMPKPKYETWFMESTLIPDYHYIEIKDDYSDMIDKIQFYIDNPEKAQEIIIHAHQYVNQFRNRRVETAIQFAVADKYFNILHE